MDGMMFDKIEKRLFDPILDGFARLESKNLQVDKIVLTRQKYCELMNLEKIKTHDITLFPEYGIGIQRKQDMTMIVSNTPMVKLYGADLQIGDTNGVYSDDIYQGFEPINFTGYFFKGNLTIIVKSRANPLYQVEPSEWKAIDTLREMISEADFRKYMAHGFILVPGISGKVYQIFREKAHTKVWENGKPVEEVCVRIADRKIPPTDNLIAFMAMIRSNEDEFRRAGNVYPMARVA